MKTLLTITMVLITGFHSSGWEPGATNDEPAQASDKLYRGDSWLPPGAIFTIQAVPDAAITFATIDITIDPQGRPLGAYQFELTSAGGPFTVVGVEAGDHPAFDHGRPPYFDRVALRRNTDRLIVGEYARPSLDAAQLPTRAVRVTTVHVMFDKPFDIENPPKLELTLTTAGDADGQKIDATPSYTFRNPERPE